MLAFVVAVLFVPPLSPSEELATFRVPRGFRVDLVVSEPDVVDPVALAFDADGRLYVAEMPGYPNGGVGVGDPTMKGRIRRLEDRDGDGRFETSIVFADGLRFPTGVCPWENGVLVGDAPDLLFLGDADGDGRAEIRKLLYTGFGNQNIQQMLNALQFHSDGWVYGCNGANESHVRSCEVEALGVSLRGRHFRFHPDRPNSLAPLTGGGQYGMSVNDEGAWFTCTNAEHIKQIAFEDRYLGNNPRLPAPPLVVQASDHGAAAKVFRISPFEEWRLDRTSRRIADPGNRKFAATELTPGGFVTSGCGTLVYRGGAFPPAFHGNAFVCDPANNLIHRDALHPDGVLFKAVRGEPDCEFLASTDRWFRPVFLAHGPDGNLYVADFYREIIETPLSLPDDIKAANDLSSRACGRIWRIASMQFRPKQLPAMAKAGNAELVDMLGDANSWRRMTAQRLLVERRAIDLATILRLFAIANDQSDPNACKHALGTLKGLRQPINAPLASALAFGSPMLQEEALRLAEPLAPQPEAVKAAAFALAKWSAPRVRFQLACSLGGCDDPRLADALEQILRQDPKDAWVQAAVLSAAYGPPAAALLERLAFDAAFPPDFTAKLIASAPDESEVLFRLHRQSLQRSREDASAWPVAETLMRKLPRRRSPAEDELVRRLADRLAGETMKPDQPISRRVEGVRLLSALRVDGKTHFRELLAPTAPPELQLAALRALADADGGVPLIVEAWKSLSPTVKTEAVETMLAKPERGAALAKAVDEKRIPLADLTPFRQRMTGHRDPKLRALSSAAAGAQSSRAVVVQRFQGAATLVGAKERGKAVFQKHCGVCHRLADEGPQVGPDLRGVLGNKTKAALLLDVFDPNRDLDPRFVNYVAELKDGRTATGLLAGETATSVTLRRSGGVDETILRSDLERLSSTGVSVMPEGMEQSITVQEAADLFEYLLGSR